MKTVGDQLPKFELMGVLNNDMNTAFESITDLSHPEKWRVIFLAKGFYLCMPDKNCGVR